MIIISNAGQRGKNSLNQNKIKIRQFTEFSIKIKLLNVLNVCINKNVFLVPIFFYTLASKMVYGIFFKKIVLNKGLINIYVTSFLQITEHPNQM